MAKFLVFGVSSFYGSNFVSLLNERGDVCHTIPPRPSFSLHDEPRRWLGWSDQDYEVVVNFMSASLVQESWADPCEWLRVNTERTTHLFNAVREKLPRARFVHVSTPESYGNTEAWVDETYNDWKPSTPYAVSRAAADMMLKAYHKAYGFQAIITRTANIYGKGQQSYRIIPKAFSCKLGGHPLQLHGSGTSIRSFIHVRDACEATRLVCLSGQAGETYHISTNEAHSIREVVEMIGCDWEPAPERLGKDHAYLLNSDKLRSMGWKDTISLEEGLKECASAH